MKMNPIVLAVAGASLIAGGQALAQGRGGGHGGGHGAGATAHGSIGQRGVDVRTGARIDSRGPDRASDRSIERANGNSVLAGTTRTRAELPGLRTGLTMRNSTGATIGTIRRINRSPDGTIRNVLVQSSTGMRTIPVAPGTLSISGDVVTTTAVRPRGGR